MKANFAEYPKKWGLIQFLYLFLMTGCTMTTYTQTANYDKTTKTMRTSIITIFAICFILTSCKDGLTEENYFLLLKDKETISLNTYGNNKIKEKKTFVISEKSIYATDQKERVAILDTAKNAITLYDIKTSKETELSIPYDIEPRCILRNNSNKN